MNKANLRVPNATTRAAMNEVLRMERARFASAEALFDDIRDAARKMPNTDDLPLMIAVVTGIGAGIIMIIVAAMLYAHR